ncbi:MAG: substrate-binding domain-containing protein [Intrasporangium sp.]|uniref:substrate-binding domain-containing protein n=1 Tax=Intrasporangium sp. TaxID=1925024 RepID=UPI003F80D804
MSQQPEAPRRNIGPYQRSLLELQAAQREGERQASRRRRQRMRIAAVVAVVTLVVAAIGTGVWWMGRPGDGTAASGPQQQRCATTTPVRIWAPASARPALDAAAKAYGATANAVCATFSVEARPAADVVADLSADGAGRPDAWVVDSPVWVDKVTTAKKVPLEPSQPFATSPLVLVVGKQSASAVPAGSRWKDLLTSDQSLRLSDPRSTTAGLLTLTTALPSLGSDAQTVLPKLAATVAPSTEELFAAGAKGKGKAAIFPAAEADVIAHNRAGKSDDLAAVVPGGQTAAFQYSLVGVATDPAKKQAIQGLRGFLTSEAAAATLAAGGLRPTADTKAVPMGSGAVSATFSATAPPAKALTAATNSWQAATLDFRLLAVIDVSGSMKERAGASTRIALTQQAATLALDALPKSTELGLWAFSIGIGEQGADYRELAPIGPLSDEQHRAAVTQGTASLSRQVGGGTGLYDTIWAAYQRVLDGWEPGHVNAVVILTDGKNDNPRGLTLAQLTARLSKADPKRPVAITTIGIGPDVDAKALSQISTMMHSEYYPAPRPQDMQEVLAKALLDHNCKDGVCA